MSPANRYWQYRQRIERFLLRREAGHRYFGAVKAYPVKGLVTFVPKAAGKPWLPIQQCLLSEILRHVLRIECMLGLRIVEIQKAGAIKFYGPHAIWKEACQRLL